MAILSKVIRSLSTRELMKPALAGCPIPRINNTRKIDVQFDLLSLKIELKAGLKKIAFTNHKIMINIGVSVPDAVYPVLVRALEDFDL